MAASTPISFIFGVARQPRETNLRRFRTTSCVPRGLYRRHVTSIAIELCVWNARDVNPYHCFDAYTADDRSVAAVKIKLANE